MLFDLRGRGRRRTVQVIYLFLAILLGGGLVFFGIGGGGSGGGLLDAITGSSGSGSSSAFSARLKADQQLTVRQPHNPAAWAQLARDHLAIAPTTVDQASGNTGFSSNATPELVQARQAWLRYLALNPKHPDASIARRMVLAFAGPGGLNDAAGAMRAQEIALSSGPPNVIGYFNLAQFAYAAGNKRVGDLAAANAVRLAPKAQRKAVSAQIALLKQQAAQAAARAAQQKSQPQSGAQLPGR